MELIVIKVRQFVNYQTDQLTWFNQFFFMPQNFNVEKRGLKPDIFMLPVLAVYLESSVHQMKSKEQSSFEVFRFDV